VRGRNLRQLKVGEGEESLPNDWPACQTDPRLESRSWLFLTYLVRYSVHYDKVRWEGRKQRHTPNACGVLRECHSKPTS
jgi:hypothetical protein